MKFISLFYSIIFLDYQEVCREEYIIFHKVNNLNFHKTLLKEFKVTKIETTEMYKTEINGNVLIND